VGEKKGKKIKLSKKTLKPHLENMLRYFEGLPKPSGQISARRLKTIMANSEAAVAAGSAECACWFKDSNAGDICVPYSSAKQCSDDKGTPVPGDCPNFFAAFASAQHLSGLLSPKKTVKTSGASVKSVGNSDGDA
jgi:hypothetical protein